jgi:hypothetical protein
MAIADHRPGESPAITAVVGVGPEALGGHFDEMAKPLGLFDGAKGCVPGGGIQGDKLVLQVCDNGRGMDAAKVREINATLTRTYEVGETSSIGLCNVHQRNVILFGEGNGIRLSSTPGFGTVVELTLPVMSKEEMERYVQGVHR